MRLSPFLSASSSSCFRHHLPRSSPASRGAGPLLSLRSFELGPVSYFFFYFHGVLAGSLSPSVFLFVFVAVLTSVLGLSRFFCLSVTFPFVPLGCVRFLLVSGLTPTGPRPVSSPPFGLRKGLFPTSFYFAARILFSFTFFPPQRHFGRAFVWPSVQVLLFLLVLPEGFDFFLPREFSTPGAFFFFHLFLTPSRSEIEVSERGAPS